MKQRKKIKLLIGVVLAALMLAACEDELMTFAGNDVIYYKWAVEGVNPSAKKPGYTDSTNVTFAYMQEDIRVIDYRIPIKVQGYTADSDRQVDVEILAETTAEEGVHFDLPASIVILADSVVGYIPITFHRTADMQEQAYSVKLRLNTNANFNTNLLPINKLNSDGRLLSYTEFEVVISDVLTQPQYWLEDYLGAFSVKKMYLWAEVLNVPIPNWEDSRPDTNTFDARLAVFKQYLIRQEKLGTPVLEDNGEPMTLGKYA